MGPEQPQSFGQVLKRLRGRAGLTQEELAARAGLSARTLSDLERGVNSRPRAATLHLLAQALQLPAAERAVLDATARPRGGGGSCDGPAFAPPQQPQRASVGSLARLPLVGRVQELAALQRQRAGEAPPLLLFAGEPGIGKTCLLQEAAGQAQERGWTVLMGGCQRRGGQEPYAPLVETLDTYLQRLDAAALSAALRGCAWLVRLLPELAAGPIEPLPSWTVAPEQERRLLFRAVGRYLANVAGPAGTLLVLDDLQWAGPDALDLLDSVVRAAAGSGPALRVAGAYRDNEVQHRDPLALLLGDLVRAELATHRVLQPLRPAEAAQLLETLLPAGDAEHAGLRARVLQRTGGVPFYLVSYAQQLRTREPETSGEDTREEEEAPWDVAQSIRQRVAALPDEVRTVLGVAAVIGRTVPTALLVAATAQAEEGVVAALEAASQARLVVEDTHGSRFAHDVIREVIEADLAVARRHLLHRRVAAAMEALYAPQLPEYYEMLAFHYQQGEGWEQALAYLVKAGDKAAAASATQEALAFYAQAVALCGTLGPPAVTTALEVAQKRGNVLSDKGDFPGAAAEFARMRLAAGAVGDRHHEAMALAYQGTALYYAHDFVPAEETLRAALTVAADRFDDVRFYANAQLGSLLAIINRHAEAAPLLAAAEELAPHVDDPYSQAWWSIIDAEWLHWTGRYDEALALLERWQPAVAATNQQIMLFWHLWESAVARGGKGDYTRALALLEEVITTSEHIGEAVVHARAANTAGWLYGELQDHERALALNRLSLAVATALAIPDTEIQSNARLNLGDSLMALGRVDEAEEHFLAVEQVVRQPRPPDHWMLWRYAQHLFHSYGELWLGRGETERALAYAEQCLALAEPSASTKNIVKACRLRGQALLLQGRLAEAEREIARALQLAQHLGNPPQLWKTYAALGELRRAQGQSEEACVADHAAATTIDQVARSLGDAALRATFLSSSHVRRIHARA